MGGMGTLPGYRLNEFVGNRGFYNRFVIGFTGIDLTEFFNQYLRDTRIPTLEYSIDNKELKYRWTNIVDGFDMPIKVTTDDKELWLFPKSEWQTLNLKNINSTLRIDKNFYVYVNKL